MIKIMTEDRNLTLKVPKEESEALFNKIALMLLGLPDNTPTKKESSYEVKKDEVVKAILPKSKVEEVKKYGGFLYIQCSHCGTVKGFCAKYPMSEYKCDNCKEVTELKGMIPMYAKCINCGNKFKYTTNHTDDLFTYNCLNCESPIDLHYNERRDQYNNLGDD